METTYGNRYIFHVLEQLSWHVYLMDKIFYIFFQYKVIGNSKRFIIIPIVTHCWVSLATLLFLWYQNVDKVRLSAT